jgi:polysaccharide biosynthesis protein PslH
VKRQILYLCHRMPWPPNKGEKIRGWHMLQHLRARFDVHLGCLADEPNDMQYLPVLQDVCASVGAFAVRRRTQMVRALLAARPGRPLLPGFYASWGLHAWVRRTLAEVNIDRVVICTVGLMPYVPKQLAVPVLLDAADIDSEKWDTYAQQSRYPMKAVWAREARTLLEYERACAARADVSFFVSEAEASRFRELAPTVAERVQSVQNGVDLESYDPAKEFADPYPAGMRALVFTGHMDYWPNADAVIWFANEVFPGLRGEHPELAFWIVGANPGAPVRALAERPGVHVTGRVPDTKPYIAHAVAAVCPLRIARGIQNKVLEAMALAKPVVASEGAFEGIRARGGEDILVAADAGAFRGHINAVLAGGHPALGAHARAAMVKNYAWDATLARMDPWLGG